MSGQDKKDVSKAMKIGNPLRSKARPSEFEEPVSNSSRVIWGLSSGILSAIVFFGVACSPHRQGPIERMTEILPTEDFGKPSEGKALILFFRPTDYAVHRQAGVFEILQDGTDPRLIGFLASETIVALETSPGKHIFMTGGYQARSMFLTANIAPDRTYPVRLQAWTNGIGAAGFLLKPEPNSHGDDPRRFVRGLRLVTTNSDSAIWVSEKRQEIRTKALAYDENATGERFAVLHP